ncbi:hypothetical protein OIDMADRAFT_16595 [Oidiodendron maius Zn]|uniref:Uncharacterized protein n=1 Tax=Oidiodendron maius (strain Zn) TaxID=913774 RepID=A0A0C3HJE4_OIDMZ|nr:hypothetical protein OIDMADRAFT_16595 [Oidiodendron maius Zn]
MLATQEGLTRNDKYESAIISLKESVARIRPGWLRCRPNFAVIWVLDDTTQGQSGHLRSRFPHSVLIGIKTIVNGIIYGERLCGTVMASRNLKDILRKRSFLNTTRCHWDRFERWNIISGEETSDNQEWCID